MLLSVVVPAYNEAEVLPIFHGHLKAVLKRLPCEHEVLYVNDGSRDDTLTCLQRLRDEDPSVGILHLSRNFGKEVAMTAGIDEARGEAVIVIDADLQDPPEVIEDLYAAWAEEGYDIAYARRRTRKGESWLKRFTAAAFYWLMAKVSDVEIPRDTGDFRLMSRRAVEALKQLREQHRLMKGLFAWVGFPSKAVFYDRDPRHSGRSKWNYLKLWNLSLEGITGFTIAPLKIATSLGLVTAAVAAVYGAIIILRTLVYGADVPGYPSLMVVVLFLGGVQLISLGVIGEYLGRLFNEAKKRPYIVQDRFPPNSKNDSNGSSWASCAPSHNVEKK
jgi:glycosyltransferase involved in cell wall biosynthesis